MVTVGFIESIVWVSVLAVLLLPAVSLHAPAATVIVLLPSEAWVTTNVYLLSLTLVKVPLVPSLTVTLLAVKPVTASLKVNVYVTVLEVLVFFVMVTVGLTESIVWVKLLTLFKLPNLSLQLLAFTVIVLLPSEACVTTNVYVFWLTLVNVPLVPSLIVISSEVKLYVYSWKVNV